MFILYFTQNLFLFEIFPFDIDNQVPQHCFLNILNYMLKNE